MISKEELEMNNSTDCDEFHGLPIVLEVHGRGRLVEEEMMVATLLSHQVHGVRGVDMLTRSMTILHDLGLVTGVEGVYSLPEAEASLITLTQSKEELTTDNTIMEGNVIFAKLQVT